MASEGGNTKHDLKTVLAAVDKGVTYFGTAKVLGVTRQTVYSYANRWPTVKRALDDKRRELVDLSEMGLRAAILRGEPWAIALALKTLGKDDGYTERTEVTGADNGPLRVQVEYVNDWRGNA